MRSDSTEVFKDIEFEHDLAIYYATGAVNINIREVTGGSYEGCDFEKISEKELSNIELDELYYIDEDINDAVQVLGQYKYKEVEQLAREVVTDMYN